MGNDVRRFDDSKLAAVHTACLRVQYKRVTDWPPRGWVDLTAVRSLVAAGLLAPFVDPCAALAAHEQEVGRA